MTGGTRCSVGFCKSQQGRDKGISFFSFPTDPKVREEWVIRCNRADKFNPNNARICSLHFLPSDYERNLKAELLKLPSRKKLKPGTIPTLLLKPGDTVPTTTPQEKEAQRKEIVSMVLKEKAASSLAAPSVSTSQNVKLTPSMQEIKTQSDLLKQIDELKKENASLTLNLKNSYLENERLTKHFEFRIGALQEVVNSTEGERNHFDAKVRELFSEQFSKNQLDIILKKKRMVKWTAQEMSHAFSLRYFSKKGYAYLRNTLKYPLPGVSTLQRWIGSLNMRKGVLKEVLSFMNIMGESLNTIEKVTVLSFSEMKVNSIYEYDPKEDEVVGPYSYMQVVMARGLFSKWKQPIFISFDTKMTPFILNTLIIELHNINFPVVACVSNCDEGNVGLWGQLGVTAENVSFSHPVTNKSIYMFADVPHLLQLTRNWLLDTGFVLDDGRKISKHPLEALINQTTSEVTSSHSLKESHINCENSQRQDVSLAVQLFSHTTAAALKSSASGSEKELALNLSEFINLFDRWFDIMNTSPVDTNLRKKAYRNTPEQNDVLNEIISTVGTMRCAGKDNLQTFQEGIIVSTTSLKKLFEDLKQEYNIKYILTSRLNQDVLEDFFSQVRGKEDLDDHPSPMNSLNRMRMILLGDCEEASEFSDTNCLEETEYACATVLKTAQLTAKIKHSTPAQVQSLNEDFEDADDSSSLSCATQDGMPVEQQSESYELKHLTQFILEKFVKQEPDPENHTEKIKNTNGPSCPQLFSLEGLVQPFQVLSNIITSMEKRFQIYHKNGRIRPGKNVVKRTTAFINKKRDMSVSTEVVEEFSRQRLLLRMKYLNQSLQESSVKRKTTETSSESAKRMKTKS